MSLVNECYNEFGIILSRWTLNIAFRINKNYIIENIVYIQMVYILKRLSNDHTYRSLLNVVFSVEDKSLCCVYGR